MRITQCACTAILMTISVTAHADFAYQETTQITGGAIVGMMKLAGAFSKQARQANAPIISRVAVQGNRMARTGQDTTEIIDLDKETIIEIDHVKRQYTEMTFAQMKQQVDAAVAKARQDQKQDQGKSAPVSDDGSKTNVRFTAHVRQTGAAMNLSGVRAEEAILTMSMDATDPKSGQTGALAITNDMWMAAEIPGYSELREFDQRYAIKMGIVLSGAMNPQVLAMQTNAGQGITEMAKEMSKLKGTPIRQVMRMGTTVNGQPLPAASEAPLSKSDGPAMPSAGDVAQQTAASAIASRLGGLGGFGSFGKKKAAPAPAADAPAPADGPNVMVESQTEMSEFSQATVEASRFAVPAGYKQVSAINK